MCDTLQACILSLNLFLLDITFSIFLLLELNIFNSCSANEEDEIILNVECHYSQAKVAGRIFNIGDCAFIKVALLYRFTIYYMFLT